MSLVFQLAGHPHFKKVHKWMYGPKVVVAALSSTVATNLDHVLASFECGLWCRWWLRFSFKVCSPSFRAGGSIPGCRKSNYGLNHIFSLRMKYITIPNAYGTATKIGLEICQKYSQRSLREVNYMTRLVTIKLVHWTDDVQLWQATFFKITSRRP